MVFKSSLTFLFSGFPSQQYASDCISQTISIKFLKQINSCVIPNSLEDLGRCLYRNPPDLCLLFCCWGKKERTRPCQSSQLLDFRSPTSAQKTNAPRLRNQLLADGSGYILVNPSHLEDESDFIGKLRPSTTMASWVEKMANGNFMVKHNPSVKI